VALIIAVVVLGLVVGFTILFRRPRARGFANLTTTDSSTRTTKEWRSMAYEARRRLAEDPDDQDALRALARASVHLGRDDTAVRLYTKKLRSDKLAAEDSYLLGTALSRLERWDDAIATWESAVKADPRHAEALDILARAYLREKQIEKAARAAEQLARLPGKEATGLLMLGVLRVEMNDPAGASEVLQRGLELDPDVRGAIIAPSTLRKALARAMLQTGRPGAAKGPLTAVLDSGADPEASWLLSRVYLQEQDVAEAKAALERTRPYSEEHPIEREPSPYVGEERCAGCHRSIFRESRASRHVRSYYRDRDLDSLPVPDRPVPDPGQTNVTHTIRRQRGRILVETHAPDRVYRALVDFAFGTADRYVTMVSHDEDPGRRARAVRLSYYCTTEGTGWDVSAGDTVHPDRSPPFLGRPMEVRDGVVRCLYCHTTNPRGGKERIGPETADHGIGCERCHGPGANHITAVKLHLRDFAIMNPSKGSAHQISAMCSECHVLNEPELEQRVSREDALWVRSPGTGLRWSRCASESEDALNCLTCHDAHRPVQTSSAHYEGKCLGCHSGTAGRSVASGSDPTPRAPQSCPVDPAKGCIECHMPKIYNATLHMTLTDHYIRKRPRAVSARNPR
jgi:cytochrome c-type biogenesis protein CcmH/NrfG